MLNKPVVLLTLMIPVWLISNILWVSLGLLLVSSMINSGRLAGVGWVLFGAYWMGQPGHYLETEDYFNIVLTVSVALFCIYLAWMISIKGHKSEALTWASYAAAICGIAYFPFAEIDALRIWLIGITSTITVQLLLALSVPVHLKGWNTMILNGHSVEIILACTAIESMALFAGVIISVRAPAVRRFKAFMVSTLAIYLLNILRNAFVLMAYGEAWFGDDSFYIAHNIIAKLGSTIALLVIAYIVLSMLPELLMMIDELAMEIKRPGGDTA